MLTLQTVPRPGSPATAPPATPSSEAAQAHDVADPSAPVTALAALVVEAGTCHLDDHAAWQRLTAEARDVVGRLVDLGEVPAHLCISDGEPAVVVRRTLAAVWRCASGDARLT